MINKATGLARKLKLRGDRVVSDGFKFDEQCCRHEAEDGAPLIRLKQQGTRTGRSSQRYFFSRARRQSNKAHYGS